jgi:hypothetical protein
MTTGRNFVRLICLGTLLLLTSLIASAQGMPATPAPLSKLDLFAGYSYWAPNARIQGQDFPIDRAGAIVTGAYYLTPAIGLELSGDLHIEASNDSMSSLAVGPIYRLQIAKRFSEFAHVLAGAADVKGPIAPLAGKGPEYGYYNMGAEWGPQLTVGGGVDWRIPLFKERFSLRVVQIDYLYSHVDYGPKHGGVTLNSFRLDTGLVWRFGGR